MEPEMEVCGWMALDFELGIGEFFGCVDAQHPPDEEAAACAWTLARGIA
jgi:hypothetical protein